MGKAQTLCRAVCLLSLALAGTWGAAAARAEAPHVEVSGFRWTSPVVGWAWGYGPGDRLWFLVSRDGGVHWRVAGSPGFVYDPLHPVESQVAVLGGRDAWDAWLTSRGELRVARTGDGGRTWTQVALPVPNVLAGGEVGALAFVDGENGWLIALSPGQGGYQEKTVLRTDDGGLRWRVVSADTGPVADAGATLQALPEEGGVRLGTLSPRCAWVGLDRFMPPGTAVNLFVTRDGGATWQPAHLPVPRALSGDGTRALAPVWEGPKGRIFVLFAHRGGGDPFTVTYGSADGGESWQALSLLPGAPVTYAFLGSEEGWLLTQPGAALFRTLDGGRHWRRLPSPPLVWGRRQYTPVELQMVSRQKGWLLVRAPNLLDAAQSPSLLLETTDGGVSWRLLLGAAAP
jgi:photosystem II stability/assembly factor-like uncharacterized protein